MNDSSAAEANSFAGLRRKNVQTLIDVLAGAQLLEREHVCRLYEENARDFDATVGALVRLGVISMNELSLCLSLSDPTAGGFSSWLIDRILACRPLADRLFAYLIPFDAINGRMTLAASAVSADHHPDVRDVLMDCHVVYFDPNRSEYSVAAEFVFLCGLAKSFRLSISPRQLKRSLASKDKLGHIAELAVVDYERRRLGDVHGRRVIHTAASNAAAGYDVESVSVANGAVVGPRYIEVKAVSRSDLHFHWTQNEVAVAEIFSACYFLYLLPVGAGGVPNLDELVVIQDPYSQVLRADGPWSVTDDVLFCRLNDEAKEAFRAAGHV